jgi:sugar phosphate isomerase/epimerase
MRFRHADGTTVHLSYCTNVHTAETLEGVLAQLREYCLPVRQRLDTGRLGVGLWLSGDVTRELTGHPAARATLRGQLERCGLEVVTLNGFPYRGFGARKVKYGVYRPDWTEPERLRYTTDLARLLAGLLPDDVAEGSVSTLPLAWRSVYGPRAAALARGQLLRLADSLDGLRARTGRAVRVGLEPEPGCAVETVADAVEVLEGLPREHLGVCLDTCHLATCFEDPAAALGALERAAVPVVKSQLSAALHTERPGAPQARRELLRYDEPRFLHQTRALTATGPFGTDDLGPALDGTLPGDVPWRTHFHVPLHAAPQPPLTATTGVLRDTLALLVGQERPLTRHLEVETYTWEALPPDARPRTRAELCDGIAAELAHVRDLLTALGLKEQP